MGIQPYLLDDGHVAIDLGFLMYRHQGMLPVLMIRARIDAGHDILVELFG